MPETPSHELTPLKGVATPDLHTRASIARNRSVVLRVDSCVRDSRLPWFYSPDETFCEIHFNTPEDTLAWLKQAQEMIEALVEMPDIKGIVMVGKDEDAEGR